MASSALGTNNKHRNVTRLPTGKHRGDYRLGRCNHGTIAAPHRGDPWCQAPLGGRAAKTAQCMARLRWLRSLMLACPLVSWSKLDQRAILIRAGTALVPIQVRVGSVRTYPCSVWQLANECRPPAGISGGWRRKRGHGRSAIYIDHFDGLGIVLTRAARIGRCTNPAQATSAFQGSCCVA